MSALSRNQYTAAAVALRELDAWKELRLLAKRIERGIA